VQVYLTRGSGSGPLNGPPVVRMQVYNPSSTVPCYFEPAPLWLQNIQYYTPSGAPVATQDGQGLWENICENLNGDEYYEWQKALMSDNTYNGGDPILPLQTATIYIPLIGNPLSCGKALIAALAGDFQVLLNFWPSSVFQNSGGNCNLVSLSIDTMQAQLSEASLSNLISQYKMGKHNWFYPFERVMTVTQNWTAGAAYQVPLTGIAGDVTLMRFALYPTLTQGDMANPVPISSFQIQNNAGEPISGMSYIDDAWNRCVMQPQYFKGRASRRTKKYAYLFSKNIMGAQQLIQDGVKYGSYPFTNKESIWINTALAGTNEVVTITPSSAPTAGTFQLQWTNPDCGTMISAPLAYNATAATIQAALLTMLNFTGAATVTGTMATAVVVTFNGYGYENRPLFADGFCLSVVNSMIGTLYTIAAPSVVTTAGVAGITSGNSYTLKIWAYTTSVANQQIAVRK
jgi:hypothetical protein